MMEVLGYKLTFLRPSQYKKKTFATTGITAPSAIRGSTLSRKPSKAGYDVRWGKLENPKKHHASNSCGDHS